MAATTGDDDAPGPLDAGGSARVMADPPTDAPVDHPAVAPPVARSADTRRDRTALRRPPPVLLAATVNTLWAAIVGYVPLFLVVALVAFKPHAGPRLGDVTRFATLAWLLAHGVPVSTGAGAISLAPLAVSVLAAWRITRAGVHTVRAIRRRRRGTARHALLAAGAVGLVYGVLGAVTAGVASSPAARVAPLRAGLTLAGFGVLAGLLGAASASGVLARVTAHVPGLLRDVSRTGTVATLLLLGAGAGVTGVAIAVAGADAADMIAAYHAGLTGQAGLVLLSLVYAPNLAVWAASYLAGPGFAVGVGTVVSAGAVRLGALPAIPAFAALPARPASALGALLLGLPLAAGMTAGWLLARRRSREATEPGAWGWGGLIGAALLAGPAAGVLLALAALVSSGGLGRGRLAEIGPFPVPLALVASGVIAVGAVIAAAATRAIMGAVVRRRGR
ncbi:MAG TPA: DUF6350 family protein [Micromonosporaceae bacterium]